MMAAHNWPINGWLPFKDLLTGHIRDQQGPVITQILRTHFQEYSIHFPSTGLEIILKEMSCGRLNASWKISSSAVDGQSFLVIDGSLLN